MANAMDTVGAKLKVSVIEEINSAAAETHTTKSAWVAQAIQEKLARDSIYKSVDEVISDNKKAIAEINKIGIRMVDIVEKFIEQQKIVAAQQKESFEQQKEIIGLLNQVLDAFNQ